MKKKNIIKSTRDFEKIINEKKIKKNKYFNIYYTNIKNNKSSLYKIGISVPKKIGKAVTRNKIKRQIKDILDKHIKIPNGFEYIIIIKKSILNIKYEEMKKELKYVFEKKEY